MLRLLPIALLLLLPACHADDGRVQTVVLVTVDTLRADHTSAFGYELPTTPALTALAARGTAFSAAYSAVPETGPSLASILTSRYPRENGVRANGDVLPAEFPTLATAFAAAGYETAAFVSTYLLIPRACGLERGFADYDDHMTASNMGHDRFERRAPETVAAALAWLDRTRGRRRFLWLHLYDPHGKYDPGEAWAKRFYVNRHRPPLDPARIQDYQRYGDSLDPDDYVARYDGEIAKADEGVGRILAAVGPDALVAFTADHGEGLGEHDYWFRHGSRLDDPALRVPLVLAGPGVPAGRRVKTVVRNLDIAPTLLALAGLPPLPHASGVSLVGRMTGQAVGLAPLPAFSEVRRQGASPAETKRDGAYLVSVTEGGWRLVLALTLDRSVLYDLATDPGEDHDVSASEPERARRLRKELDAFVARGDRRAGDEVPADVEEALKSHGYVR